MPGLVPGIHAFLHPGVQVVDARDEPGHDAVKDHVTARSLRWAQPVTRLSASENSA
jgi:hypothetical protein